MHEDARVEPRAPGTAAPEPQPPGGPDPSRAPPPAPPLTFRDAAKELFGDRMVQAILVAAALFGALELGLFG